MAYMKTLLKLALIASTNRCMDGLTCTAQAAGYFMLKAKEFLLKGKDKYS
jgi:hypothetical protein